MRFLLAVLIMMAVLGSGGYEFYHWRNARLLLNTSVPSRPRPALSDQQQLNLALAERLDPAIAETARAVESLALPDGRFVYMIKLLANDHYVPPYSITHHLDVMYGLTMYSRISPDPVARRILLNSANFLMARALRPVTVPTTATSGGPGLRAAALCHRRPKQRRRRQAITYRKVAPVSRPEPVLACWTVRDPSGWIGPRDHLSLSGTPQALIALIQVGALYPGTIPYSTLKGLGRFLLAMQKPTGEFYTSFPPRNGVVDPTWSYAFFEGRSSLAFLMLYEMDHSKVWFDAAVRGLDFISEHRMKTAGVTEDNWSLMAIGELFGLYRRDLTARFPDKNLLLRHAQQIAMAIVSNQRLGRFSEPLYGSFNHTENTLDTAVRLRGLGSAYWMLSQGEPVIQWGVWNSIKAGDIFLIRSMMANGPYKGMMLDAARDRPSDKLTWNENRLRVDITADTLTDLVLTREIVASFASQAPRAPAAATPHGAPGKSQ